MEMGVATAAQATGAAGAMLCAVIDGEAGEAIAQFGSPIAAPGLAHQAIEIRQPFRSLSAGRRLLALPGELGGRVAGVLMLWRPEDQPDWPDDDLFLLRELTDQLAVAIAQAEEQEALSRLSQTDALTGLLNRRGFEARLKDVVAHAKLTRTGGALVYIDFDNCKQINDRYGHAQGDAALKAVADVIASQARRPLDLAARCGGEEFVVVWYHPAPQELAHMGEQLRASVRALGLQHADGENGGLSVSVGIASMVPIAGQCSAELLQVADAALFQAKDQGRDRVVALVHPRADTVMIAPAPEPAGMVGP
jgi:diguanylate cyclase (GGDEF)-like protein